MTKLDTVPLDRKHKKLLSKLKKTEKKLAKHSGRMSEAERKTEKARAKKESLEDKIAEYEQTHHEQLAAVGQNSQPKKTKR